MALEVGGHVRIDQLPHSPGERVRPPRSALREQDQHRGRELHPLRYSFLASSTQRSSSRSRAVGGSTHPTSRPDSRGHPTLALTSAAVTPGYSAARMSSPVPGSAARIALSVITLTGPAPGIPSSPRRTPAERWPGLVTKSTDRKSTRLNSSH